MSHRSPAGSPARLVAVLGPTNTGKTHLAVERMLGHASGMIGLPLRLLAREIYDRVAKVRGAGAVALITGEEKIVPPRAHYYVCTVEAMPLDIDVEFLAVDDIQLAADPERGHVFTDRLLHARGRHETMLLGAATMAPLIRRLTPQAQIVARERYSALSWSGAKKLSRLPRRSAVVAFSGNEVYAIAELIRRQRGGAAVVMGSLSPRTRNAQVALYQSGQVDFLVATDAIGMGLNMDVGHVAFAGLAKFDGRHTRALHAHEIGQIAGRAGRFQSPGSFGVTGASADLDPDIIERVEHHDFEPVAAAEWRNGELDFISPTALIGALSTAPPRAGLKAAERALDETALRHFAADPSISGRRPDRLAVARLWEVCQTPDFRKTTLEDHLRLLGDLHGHLGRGAMRLPDDWMAAQLRPIDRLDGEIDALSARLAAVRTLAYVANRPSWVGDPAHWRERCRSLEDALSDTLHEKLMAQFIDRRTSALVRGLRSSGEILAGVAADGTVTVEGHFVGRLAGVHFALDRGAGGALEEKTLRAAARRAVAPEVAHRLGRLAAEPDEAFALTADGDLLWRGEAAGVLVGDQPFSPKIRLYGELGPETARTRAARRLEAFVAAEAGRRLTDLKRLSRAVADGEVKGLARGIAWRLVEAGGVLGRHSVEDDVRNLSAVERRALRGLGVRIGAFSLFLPSQLAPEARALAGAFALRAQPPRSLGLRGLLAVGSEAAPVETLERLAEFLRSGPRKGGGVILTAQALAALGWSAAQAATVLRGLGWAPTAPRKSGPPLG